MMQLTAEQNLVFMSDPRRVAAQKALDGIVHHIRSNAQFEGNVQYYLTTLPPLLRKLDDAYNDLAVVEATITAEILGQNRYHG